MQSQENNEKEEENQNESIEKETKKKSTKAETVLPQSAMNGANSAATNNGFRVKNVSEINADATNINGGAINERATTNKRKFPASTEQEENKENGGKANQSKNNKHHNDEDDNHDESSDTEHNQNEKKCKRNEATANNSDNNSTQQTSSTTTNINNNNNKNNAVSVPKPLPEIKIETEEVDNESSAEIQTDNNTGHDNRAVEVKVEPVTTHEAASTAQQNSDKDNSVSVPKPFPEEVKAVKTEPQNTNDEEASCSHTNNGNRLPLQSPVKEEKADASSTTRESCRFGIRCYRRNILHRQQEAHPGDVDYRRPDYPTPPTGTPPCPFGNICYRRNPSHFQEYSHPPNSEYQIMPLADFKENYRNYRRRQTLQHLSLRFLNEDSSDNDDGNIFSDSGSEYMVTDNEDSLDSEESMGDYDDCDRAEE